MNAGPPHGRPKKGSLPASLEQHEKPSLEASAGATIRLGVDPHATNPRGAPRRVANIAPGGKASSAKGARIDSPYRPLLTAAARPSTFAVRATDETGAVRETPIAGEHPLTLYVDKHELVTLMTLGAAPEALAIGYLRNQRLLERIEDIVAVQVDWDVSAVVVKTRHGLANIEAKTQKRTTTSGCGQGTMFGDLMEEIDKVRLPTGATLSQPTLYALLDRVRVHETIYKQAGAVHGCALATNEPAKSEILIFVEDVGRHNAVDAIAGPRIRSPRGSPIGGIAASSGAT